MESLAVRWLFRGKEVKIETRCLDCGEPIVVRMRDDNILEINPPSIVGHMNAPFAKALTHAISWGMA